MRRAKSLKPLVRRGHPSSSSRVSSPREGHEPFSESDGSDGIVLIAVVDKSGRGGVRKVEEAFEEVELRYAEHGLRLRSPVSAEIVSMPIMGASKSLSDRHTLFVSVRAVQSGTLDGLVAHEMGHMLRTEARHVSHDPDVYRKTGREVRIPRAAEGAFSGAFNHIQDIYADDLAFLVFASDGGDRAYRFFAGWVAGNAETRGQDRWQNVGLAVTNGFALGNLVRHRLIRPDDPLWDRARAFDRDAGFGAVDSFAEFFANLPNDPPVETFLLQVRTLAGLMTKAAEA